MQQYASGGDLVREITDAALPGDLAQRLIDFACRALIDWRSQLGLPVLDPISWHAATNHARATDEVVRTLIAHGARVDRQSLAHLASNNGNELADLAQRLDGTIDNRGALGGGAGAARRTGGGARLGPTQQPRRRPRTVAGPDRAHPGVRKAKGRPVALVTSGWSA
ncbi:hypothetical protein CGZ93_07290 [Enemella dayhoffiae]|uniref:Uncharacterized protein n=1 Tax=Enemella dayhoffiae TaxID=2016507 RepID=A0A255H6A4_9ACTN|nr:hypothetical protein CGZ93_07290 [Enemella dayhoffiae]